jgi:hypothetical protein
MYEGDKIVINPKALLIPEFTDLYERDRSAGKKKAAKEFAYIYYIADYKSEYNAYGLAKEKQLGIDIFQQRNYKPDPMVKKAIDKYIKLQETPSMQYLIAIRNRVQRVIQFIDKAEIENKDIEGTYKNPFITIEKVTKVFRELEDVIEKLEKWEKKVFDEEEEMQIRGGGMLNAFENSEDAKWLKR